MTACACPACPGHAAASARGGERVEPARHARSPAEEARGEAADPRLPAFLRRPAVPPEEGAAAPVVAALRFDRQGRVPATAACRALGWPVDAELVAVVDLDRHRLWVRSPTGPGSPDDAPAWPQLPDGPAGAGQPVRLDAAGRLVLRPGLLRALGLAPPADVVMLAVPALAAALLVPPGAVAAALLGQHTEPTGDRPPAWLGGTENSQEGW